MPAKPDPIGCSSGCKRQAADEDAALAMGWEVLPITGRWRCPTCTHELRAASTLGSKQEEPDASSADHQ